MSGFVIPNLPADTTPTDSAPAVEPPIVNDGWFPDIVPADLRKQVRVRDTVTIERLRAAVLFAIISVGNQLVVWQAARAAEGRTRLADVPAPQIDGESRLTILYRTAVYAEAKARLVESYRDTDLTGAGQRKVDDLDPSISELRRDAIHAVRDILGRTRTSVELI
ncbi:MULTISPECIES: head completion/stabilization protein [unclassified Sphingomonas]|uniref:head completion/stabilization protein n=1 Tax=unclassified Sphingomonas TaxID=196159 RepID=UPI00226A4BA0|nr:MULTISPECIES: head completion/stabilization protein [unclassified Sphingomonas]